MSRSYDYVDTASHEPQPSALSRCAADFRRGKPRHYAYRSCGVVGGGMRRLVDLVICVAAAVVVLPLALVVAVTIRWACGSPVLFRQERWGQNRRIFVIWKFRTMRPAAYPGEPDGARLNRLGRFLRASSLDELPQLWNIIRGDMSLIGPRPWPVMPGDETLYTRRQWGRLAVRPGLTGWAQVNGRNSLPLPDRIEQDLWYIAHRSVLLDLRIAALTVVQLIRPRGVVGYGVANPGFTATRLEPAAGEGPASPARLPGSPHDAGSYDGRRSGTPQVLRRISVTDVRGAQAPANSGYREVGR
jgi:lipopolysaccharide/colanic/teichoic acid biosynthesis glycosyltransferase